MAPLGGVPSLLPVRFHCDSGQGGHWTLMDNLTRDCGLPASGSRDDGQSNVTWRRGGMIIGRAATRTRVEAERPGTGRARRTEHPRGPLQDAPGVPARALSLRRKETDNSTATRASFVVNAARTEVGRLRWPMQL